jgi:hypothetical protein
MCQHFALQGCVEAIKTGCTGACVFTHCQATHSYVVLGPSLWQQLLFWPAATGPLLTSVLHVFDKLLSTQLGCYLLPAGLTASAAIAPTLVNQSEETGRNRSGLHQIFRQSAWILDAI